MKRVALSLHLMKCCFRKALSLRTGQLGNACPVLLHMAQALLVLKASRVSRCVSRLYTALIYASTIAFDSGPTKSGGMSRSGIMDEPGNNSTKLTLRVYLDFFTGVLPLKEMGFTRGF